MNALLIDYTIVYYKYNNKTNTKHLPNNKLNSDNVFGHTLVAPNSKHNKHITCGDQQHTNIIAAPTNILANLRRDRNVDVCGNGRPPDDWHSSCFFCLCCLCICC